MSHGARRERIVIVVRVIAVIATVAIVAGCAGAPSTGQTPSSAEPSSAEPLPIPADATLTSNGGPAAIAGVVGSWSLDGMVADAPWLPAEGLAAIDVQAGTALSVALGDAGGIGGWTARIAEASDRDGTAVRVLAEGDAGGDPKIAFASPGPGEWVLAVTLAWADGRGRATYSWAVSVR